MKHIGLYIHIPFCAKKCDYCDFKSFDQNNSSIIISYIECLKQEIQEVGDGINSDAKMGKNDFITVDTIYIGGGTPSFIDSKYIEDVMSVIKGKFTLSQDIEITIEINPGTVNKEKLKIYKESGINRCSIGLQATRNELLRLMGRIHNTDDFFKTYELARNIGFDNSATTTTTDKGEFQERALIEHQMTVDTDDQFEFKGDPFLYEEENSVNTAMWDQKWEKRFKYCI